MALSNRDKAAVLRKVGWSYADIARHLGVTPAAVWKWCNPERTREWVKRDNANPARKAAKATWGREHIDQTHKDDCACGDRKWTKARHCRGCYEAIRAVRRSVVEGIWADGWTHREINETLGVSGDYIGPRRAEDWDLPHRYRMQNGRRVAA